MTKMHIVLAGRFAPFGHAHLARVVDEIESGKTVTILVTGADASLSSRLPWTAAERLEMCRQALAEFGEQIDFVADDDHPYDPEAARGAMVATLTSAMKRVTEKSEPPHLGDNLYLEGASRLYMTTDDLTADEDRARAAYFAGDDAVLKTCVPPVIFDALQRLRQAESFKDMADEYRYVTDYRKSWEVAPYPPIFVTVDMVIVHSGRVLLIQRGGQPGRGLWALPGGFVDADETLEEAALRELREETGLDLGWSDERVKLKASHVFDDPQRSARGRTITHAYHVELAADETPMVTASDDAAAAHWLAIEDLSSLRNQFFEDHGHILNFFLET